MTRQPSRAGNILWEIVLRAQPDPPDGHGPTALKEGAK